MINRPDKMFGPAGVETNGEWKISCVTKGRLCIFLIGDHCTHVKPSLKIADTDNTPEWCEMREDIANEIQRLKKGAA